MTNIYFTLNYRDAAAAAVPDGPTPTNRRSNLIPSVPLGVTSHSTATPCALVVSNLFHNFGVRVGVSTLEKETQLVRRQRLYTALVGCQFSFSRTNNSDCSSYCASVLYQANDATLTAGA